MAAASTVLTAIGTGLGIGAVKKTIDDVNDGNKAAKEETAKLRKQKEKEMRDVKKRKAFEKLSDKKTAARDSAYGAQASKRMSAGRSTGQANSTSTAGATGLGGSKTLLGA
jgi:hypothetical protein